MSEKTFSWRGATVTFRIGESIAAALAAVGIHHFGRDALGGEIRYFCGIGACQSCLVRVDGAVMEACLTVATPGLCVQALEDADV